MALFKSRTKNRGEDRHKQAQDKTSALAKTQTRAYKLAKRLPDLLVDARRAAHTITMGSHGRRRAGTGETFWQFRQFQDSDNRNLVDWRRSASSDHLYVREREWEAAHTVWIWPDLSPSMDFRSHLSKDTKIERALVFTFAMADLLSRSGERVGVLGLLPPKTARNAGERCAAALAGHLRNTNEPKLSLPAKDNLQRYSDCLMFSDFLEPIDQLQDRLSKIGALGVRGQLVQILDPAEESLPYSGRIEFQDSETNAKFMSERAEALREKFSARMREHRDKMRQFLKKMEWSLLVHYTDRPVEETLLSLHTRLSGLDHQYSFAASRQIGRSRQESSRL